MSGTLVKKISTELSLWDAQKLALRIFDNKIESIDLKNDKLKTIEKLVTPIIFDTKFPSFTFDMATGSGKTRVLAACLSYLFQKGISKNFFILAPGEVVYRKLIDDFTKSNSKFQLQGWSNIPDFEIITGDNYERYDPYQTKIKDDSFHLFIFNIDKFRRKDKSTLKFFGFKERLGDSFGNMLSQMSDLVMFMDESHHYRADLTKESIEGLNPILGLEFTATPNYTKNILYSYSLADAVNDNIVKRLEAVVKQDDRSFNEELDDLKLLEGLKLHELKKTHLSVYTKNYDLDYLKPITFISTKDISHGTEIQDLLESKDFLDGKYTGKTLFVHSGSPDEQIQQLLQVENPENEIEIIIHVNKLTEGWDIKNIFTIIPLRASLSTTLTEQTIGRGVRNPFPLAPIEHMKNFPNAFTLQIIAFSGKDDNYKDVVEKSKKNNIVIKQYDEIKSVGKDLEKYEIKIENPKHLIKIPLFKSVEKDEGQLSDFPISPEYEKLQPTLNSKIAGVDLSSNEIHDLGKAVDTTITGDPISYLIDRLFEKIDEIDQNDRALVKKLVNSYLKQASKSSNKSDWSKLFLANRSTIFTDIKNQIVSNVQNSIKLSHSFDKTGFVQFSSYFVTKEHDKSILLKSNLFDEKTSNIFSGYKKCIYSEMKFDSKQEKFLADLLDDDKKVIHWLKNPVSKTGVGIKYKFGEYYPDFFVETNDTVYVIEVKGRRDIKTPDVQEKGVESSKWCKKLSANTKKSWIYGIVPHDDIKRGDSFDRIIGNMIKI